jgi:hypothetical protein
MPITLVTPTAGPAAKRTVDPASQTADHAADPARNRVPPLVIAHRGASETWPENTIPAFMAGIDQGADMIETDVHMSADGELIIMHDTTVDRTTDARALYPGRTDRSIAAMNAAQIATLDAGSWKGERFAGIGVPRLAEVAQPHPVPTVTYRDGAVPPRRRCPTGAAQLYASLGRRTTSPRDMTKSTPSVAAMSSRGSPGIATMSAHAPGANRPRSSRCSMRAAVEVAALSTRSGDSPAEIRH